MSTALQRKPAGLIHTVKSLLGLRAQAAPSPQVTQVPAVPAPSRPGLPYTEAQQRELERLLAKLLSKRSLITSGKLHIIGFESLRDRLGQRWPVLRASVYKIAQEVIRAHMAEGDFHLRYNEDSYLFVFAQATLDEGAVRAQRIADEIGARLETVDPEALNAIRVDGKIGAVDAQSLIGKPLAVAMDIVDGATREGAQARAQAARAAAKAPKCDYIPLWEVKAGALSMYVCDLGDKSGRTPLEKDIDLLRAAKAELRRMEETGRDFTLLVPVRHATLYNADASQKYQMIYRDVPPAHRKNIVFLITQYMEGLPENIVYWFLPALKTACGQVFAEMPLRGKAGLSLLKSRGIDGLCVTVPSGVDEAVTLGHLRSFSDHARQAGFAQVMVLGLPSLSLATSASCMGFTGLGGAAIHDAVEAPDTEHKFRYATIFSDEP